MLFEPDDLYESVRELSGLFLDKALPAWDELSWKEKDEWQERADEINEARADDRSFDA